MPSQTEEDKLKITILLAEYSTLRTEAIARGAHLFQASTIAAAAVIFLIGAFINLLINADKLIGSAYRYAFWSLIFALLLGLSVTAFLYWMIWRDLHKAVQRVREIEIDINDRVGEDLLIWENLWGGAKTGFFGNARPLPRSTFKTVAFPVRSRGGELIPPPDNNFDSGTIIDVSKKN